MAYGADQVRLPTTGKSKGKQVFGPFHETALTQSWYLSSYFDGEAVEIKRGKHLLMREPRLLDHPIDLPLAAFHDLYLRQMEQVLLEAPSLFLSLLGDLGMIGYKSRQLQ